MNPATNQKTIAIHQPNYLPWLGYFYKIDRSDVFVFLDDVQFSNKGMHNYTYINTPNGPFRLKYPVQQSLGDNINEVTLRNELGWVQKHLKTIETNYRKAPYFEEVFEHYSSLLQTEYEHIVDLNISLIKFFVDRLGLDTEFVISSELGVHKDREERIITICKQLEGAIYYSGTGAKAYQDEDLFKKEGISLEYLEFAPVNYQQLWGEFQSNVTALDYFMNCGYNWEFIRKSQDTLNK